MKAGEIITQEHVKSIRPGFGMHPIYYKDIIGKKINKSVKRGTPLVSEMIE